MADAHFMHEAIDLARQSRRGAGLIFASPPVERVIERAARGWKRANVAANLHAGQCDLLLVEKNVIGLTRAARTNRPDARLIHT